MQPKRVVNCHFSLKVAEYTFSTDNFIIKYSRLKMAVENGWINRFLKVKGCKGGHYTC